MEKGGLLGFLGRPGMSARHSRNMLYVNAAVLNELDRKGYRLADTILENGDVVLHYEPWRNRASVEADFPLLVELGSVVKVDVENYQVVITPQRRYDR
jgi:hypothetical protein